jgi:NAD-dependent SIR2 family protein deacetylase
MKLSTPVVDIASLAKLILHPDCQSIAFLTGAGVSVASGIPDFRSPGGMYDTLQPQLLTATPHQRRLMAQDPTYVVSWDVFQHNAFPYLEVRRPFILGTQQQRWKPTIAHRFMELLHTKTKKLTRIYTQNIDGLDHQCTEIPRDKIVNVHGTLSKAACEGCQTDMDFTSFCQKVQSNIKDIYTTSDDDNGPSESTPILCPHCGQALVKPTTVLFGRSLPEEFHVKSEQDLPTLDILIVAGTSLVVAPANSLVYRVPEESTMRVVVNTEAVGQELGLDYNNNPKRDFLAQGECDAVFLQLIEELGWLEDLESKQDLLPPKSRALLESRASHK